MKVNPGKITADPMTRLVLEKYETPHWIYSDQNIQRRNPNTPSHWFAHCFPREAEKFGPPILEQHSVVDNVPAVHALQLNEDFFAAILGNEKCGRAIWYTPEQRWYRKTGDYFNVATDEELKLVLSQQFIRCCQDMAFFVDLEALFGAFRQDDVLESVLRRATAVLAKDQEFFNDGSGNVKSAVLLPEEGAKQFVCELLSENEEGWITVEDCFNAYMRFSQLRALPAIPRRRFRSTVNSAIRTRFNRSLRKDLLQFGASRGNGWKGVILKEEIV